MPRIVHLLCVTLLVWGLLVSAGKNYYDILGVDKSASKREIKKSYKTLSKKYHPDKNQGDKTAQQKFIELAQAYEVLTDDEKRRIYDQYGEEGLKDSGQQFHDPFDIFSQFSGFGFGGGQQQRTRKGPEIKLPLEVTLEELFSGKVLEVDMNKQILCPTCRGSGAKDSNDVHTCSSCQGRGVKIVRQQLAPGMYQQMQMQCDACGGKGKIVKSKCPSCKGAKVRRGSTQMTVTIERGMRDGQEIRFEREGDQGPDMTPGDVVFELRASSHPVFERKGDHLYVSDTLLLREALLGFNHSLTHLDGAPIAVTRSEDVTQPGFVQELLGQGMPKPSFPSERGNLYVSYQVLLPPKLTPEARAALGEALK